MNQFVANVNKAIILQTSAIRGLSSMLMILDFPWTLTG
jgi:hypothetical protein